MTIDGPRIDIRLPFESHQSPSIASASAIGVKINETLSVPMKKSIHLCIGQSVFRRYPGTCQSIKSGHVQCNSPCPLWAKSGHCAIHSTASSALRGDGMMSTASVFCYTENVKDESYGCHITSHNPYRRNRGCHNFECCERAHSLDPRRALVRNSLVFGAFGGLSFALLLPLRPFPLLFQRRLSPLLQRSLSLLL